jgi:hypothetical protein
MGESGRGKRERRGSSERESKVLKRMKGGRAMRRTRRMDSRESDYGRNVQYVPDQLPRR